MKMTKKNNPPALPLVLVTLLIAGTLLLSALIIGFDSKEAEIFSAECQQVEKKFAECREELDQCVGFSYKP